MGVPSQISTQANAIILAATNRMIQLGAQASNNIVNGIESKKQLKTAKQILYLLTAYVHQADMTMALSDSLLYALRQLSGQYSFPGVSPIVGQALNVQIVLAGNNIIFYNQGALLGVASQVDFEGIIAALSAGRLTVSLPAGTVDYLGDYDASSNNFPSTGSGSAGIVKAGNMWNISVGGSPGGEGLSAGATIMAKIDNPGQTLANWKIWF